mgnify:FL=1
MAGGNIGDDRVWLYSDTYQEYVSDYPECDPKSEAYISVHAIEMVLNMLEGAACVERRGSAYFIRDKLGLLPDATPTTTKE